MTQRAVCSFFSMRSLICVRLFRPRLKLIFQVNRLKLPRANCLKPSLNSRRFDQLIAFVMNLLDEQLRKFSHPPSPWLIGILLVSSCDRCIGPEKNFFIQSPTSYFFLSETWNVSFHHVIHTVANDMNQIVFTVFQNSVPYLWLTVT